MAAAPQYGTLTFIGQGSRSISVDVYLSDVANALVNFGVGGGSSSTSPTEWRAPEGCVLTDFIIVTGMTDTTKIQPTRNNQNVDSILRYALHDDGLAFRAPLRIPFAAGDMLTITQLA